MRSRHAPILETRPFSWPHEAGCASFAAALAQQTGLRQAYVELHGPLGAGKTTFVRHLLRALGVTGRIKRHTYTVVEPYTLPGPAPGADPPIDVWHFDFYRFSDPREWEDAGFREIFAAPGLKLAEWPERAGDTLPVADLRLHITPQLDDSRLVQAEAGTPLGQALLAGVAGIMAA